MFVQLCMKHHVLVKGKGLGHSAVGVKGYSLLEQTDVLQKSWLCKKLCTSRLGTRSGEVQVGCQA